MTDHESEVPHIADPQSGLETALIEEFLRTHGHDPEALRGRGDRVALDLLAEASRYASMKLAEMESRGTFVQDLHRGQHDGG